MNYTTPRYYSYWANWTKVTPTSKHAKARANRFHARHKKA